MPDRPSFPIPEELEPETFCLCLQIPNDPVWKTVIAGLLFQPAEWFNWQRDDDRSGKILAHYWRTLYNEIDWSTMSCCCDDTTIVIIQISPSGEVEVSTDGGETYTPAPEQDPRNGVPRLPPALPPGGADDKCTYADSVVELFKQGVIDVLEEASTVQEIIAIITGILAGVLGFAGPILTFIGAVIAVLANGIFAAGVSAVQAAYTEDFWNMLRCLIYLHINADGSFTQSQLDAIYAGMSGDAIAIFITQNWLAALGTAGMTNSARALYGSPTADCDCSEACSSLYDIYGTYGTLVDSDDTSITVEATFDGPNLGGYGAGIKANDFTNCCYISYELVSGTITNFNGFWSPCGTDCTWPALPNSGLHDAGCDCMHTRISTVPFTIKYIFSPCE